MKINSPLFTLLASALLCSHCSCGDENLSGTERKSQPKDLIEVNLRQELEIKDSIPGISLLNNPDYVTLIQNGCEGSMGYFQGVSQSDSTGPYVKVTNYNGVKSFELFYIPLKYSRQQINSDSFLVSKPNYDEDYLCVAFVYAMANPADQENYQADPTSYPANVKCYTRDGKGWKFFTEAKVKNLTDLSLFQIRSIYKIKPDQ